MCSRISDHKKLLKLDNDTNPFIHTNEWINATTMPLTSWMNWIFWRKYFWAKFFLGKFCGQIFWGQFFEENFGPNFIFGKVFRGHFFWKFFWSNFFVASFLGPLLAHKGVVPKKSNFVLKQLPRKVLHNKKFVLKKLSLLIRLDSLLGLLSIELKAQSYIRANLQLSHRSWLNDWRRVEHFLVQ